MITVEPTTDANFIKSVFYEPAIFSEMTDDSFPTPEGMREFDVLSLPAYFLRVLKDGVACGCFMLMRKDGGIEAHTALLPTCRGRDAITATKAAMKWVWENTDAGFIRSYAWSDSPAVAWFCRAVGLRPAERAPWPATRHGRPVEIQWFNLNREEALA